MNKITFIDIDNVIADPSARFAKAEEAKMAYLATCELPEQDEFFGTRVGEHVYQDSDVKRATNIYWRTAFTPELVRLDTLIDGTREALDHLDYVYERLYLLTSRPESMRQATVDWFWRHSPVVALRSDGQSDPFILKPASQQYVKTITWKSGVVELLVRLFGVDELLYVDDEPRHREAIAALNLPCELKIAASLQEAIALDGGES